jgi:hypothetical protein
MPGADIEPMKVSSQSLKQDTRDSSGAMAAKICADLQIVHTGRDDDIRP